MTRCPKCANEAPAEARFCPHCGFRLPSQEISPLAAILVVALAFITAVFGLPLLYLAGLPLTLPAISVVGELVIFLFPLVYMVYKKVDVGEYVMFGRLKHFIPGLGLGIALQGISIILSLVLTYLLGPSVAIEETERLIINLARESPIATMLFLLLPGLCEEFAFRCFLQNALARRYSLALGLIGSSLAFGLAHPDPQAIYIILTFVVGLLLGFFYSRFRSYVMVATAHATFNLITFALLVLVG